MFSRLPRTQLLNCKEASRSYAEYYVIFSNSDGRYWWQCLMRPGFEHCYAIKVIKGEWFLFHQSIGFSDIEWINPGVVPVKGDLIVLKVQAWREQRYRVPIAWAPSSCVEGIKALLGIRGLFILTPFQLYKYLRKYDGIKQPRTVSGIERIRTTAIS